MNKTLILIILGILLAGGGLYFYTTSQSSDDGAGTTIEPEEGMEKSDDFGMSTSLKDLLGMGKNQQCTFSSGSELDGKVYMAGDRVRSEFTIVDETSGATTASMIQDGGYMYYWTSLTPQGMKMQLNVADLAEEYSDQTPASLSQSLDLDAEMDFDCNSWIVDESKFELPSDVQFIDLSEQFSY